MNINHAKDYTALFICGGIYFKCPYRKIHSVVIPAHQSNSQTASKEPLIKAGWIYHCHNKADIFFCSPGCYHDFQAKEKLKIENDKKLPYLGRLIKKFML